MLRGEILTFFLIALPESDQHSTWKLVVGRWISFWDGLFSRAKWQNVSFREGMFIRILVFTNHDLVGAVFYLSPKKLNQPSIARISLDTCQSMREDPIASTRVNHDSTGACHDCILKRYLSLPQASSDADQIGVKKIMVVAGTIIDVFRKGKIEWLSKQHVPP